MGSANVKWKPKECRYLIHEKARASANVYYYCCDQLPNLLSLCLSLQCAICKCNLIFCASLLCHCPCLCSIDGKDLSRLIGDKSNLYRCCTFFLRRRSRRRKSYSSVHCVDCVLQEKTKMPTKKGNHLKLPLCA